jgi:hypothetical protein
MQNVYSHRNKSKIANKDKQKLSQINNLDRKSVVDINTLLNRVRTDERNKIKQQIIFFSSVTLALGFFATFIALVK